MLTLTFKSAKDAGACVEAYKKFAKFKGGVSQWGSDKPFPLLEVLDNNGLGDALWALRCCQPEVERDRIARLFACDCAESVLPLFGREYPSDNRPHQAIEVARRFANGEASQEELAAARAAAGDAAWAAAWAAAGDAARAAAGAAARAAVGAAARAAVGDAARAAAGDAARAAAWAAAGDAARDAAKDAQAQILRKYLIG